MLNWSHPNLPPKVTISITPHINLNVPVTHVFYRCSGFSEIFIFGYADNVPMHIPRFHFVSNLEMWGTNKISNKSLDMLFVPAICTEISAIHKNLVYVQVLGTRYLVPDTWYLVPGTWYQIPGTFYLVSDTWYLVPGTRYQVPRYQVPGARYLVPCTWYQVPGTWYQVYQVPGTRYLVPGTRYQVPGAWNKAPRYLVPGTR